MSRMSNAILRASPLPTAGPYPTLDPFLFCVYHRDDYPADESGGKMETLFPGNGADFDPDAPYRMYHGEKVPGFPQHPHRGFETITATMEGLIDHADSVGNAGRYGEGDVQWMTAGSGIVHGEMFPLVHADRPNTLRLFQIWLNLPAKSKMAKPSFAMFWADDVHVWSSDDGKASVTVWAGEYFGNEAGRNVPPPDSWAANPGNDVALLHMTVRTGGKITVPRANQNGVNRTLYLIEGHTHGAKVDGKKLNDKLHMVMDPSKEFTIELGDVTTSDGRTEFLLLQGKPIGEPVAQHGPFVMNTRGEIQEAFMDYQRTRFGGWPWPRDDMIFPHNKGRFALIEGEETRPSQASGKEPRREEL